MVAQKPSVSREIGEYGRRYCTHTFIFEVSMSETALTVVDSEQQKRWNEMADAIKKASEARRRQRTPQSKIKTRSGGGDKSFSYVDRADYQIWLDEKFPGWSIEEFEVWTEKSTTPSQTNPILFCAKFMLVIIDSGLAKRRIPCVGTASVALKELERDNAQLLKQKFNMATTEAYKMGCNWLGAFFDLRADDEERAKAARPATDAQLKRFTDLLAEVPVEHKDTTTKAWNKMNESTADKFLDGLQEKVNKLKQAQEKG
jgi:hypothetical protein